MLSHAFSKYCGSVQCECHSETETTETTSCTSQAWLAKRFEEKCAEVQALQKARVTSFTKQNMMNMQNALYICSTKKCINLCSYNLI